MRNNSLKVLKIFIKNASLFEENFEFDLLTKINTVQGKNDHGINNIINRVYVHDVLAITGINAAGKTITLKTISSLLNFYLRLENLNEIDENMTSCFLKPLLCFGMYICDSNFIYKIETTIDKETGNFQDSWIIKEETLSRKPINAKVNRENIYDNNYTTDVIRSGLKPEQKEYLSKDISIFKSIVDKNTISLVMDSFYLTNHNFFSTSAFIRNENDDDLTLSNNILKYLDPSIEYIKKHTAENNYTIKFINDPKLHEVKSIFNLENYLSSGTIKGIALMNYIISIIKHTGYFFIDEIEIHLNKAIVQSIIRLFSDSSTNPHHATLVFSTHYSELLDCLDRNDSIIITRKNSDGKISVSNLAEMLKRNDIKKSDVYLSDFLQLGTAPSYNAYIDFINEVKKITSEGATSK